MNQQNEEMFYVRFKKHFIDSEALADKIIKEEWVDDYTNIVVCAPAYSSITAQIVNHKLSNINNQLLPSILLEIPQSNMSQVWNPLERQFQTFDIYMKTWLPQLETWQKYLFLFCSIEQDKYINTISRLVKIRVPAENIRVACLYKHVECKFLPDIEVQEYKQDKIIFQWENINIK